MPAHQNETTTTRDAPTAQPHRDRGDANHSGNHNALGVGPQTSKQDYQGREGKEETRKKTEKILEEFLKRSMTMKANGSAVRQKHKLNNSHQARLHEANRVVADGPRKAPLNQSDERKLQDLMSGTGLYRSSRQMSNTMAKDQVHDMMNNLSCVQTSLTSSGSEGERFHRTQSFAKAQRHSIVTKLEHEAEEKTSKRRNSEDIQSQPMHAESTIADSTGRSNNTAPPHVAHSRASSDPVTTLHGIAEKRQPHKKGQKAKKSWASIFSLKKRSVHKVDRDSETRVETDVCGPPGSKFPRTPSDRKVTRESSVNERRRTPSPPKSRTPKILRRFSSRFKKSPSVRSESPTGSHLKTPGSSQSFDAVLDVSHPADGETKSNSLPKEAVLSTHHNHKTHHSSSHRVVIDGSTKHGHKHAKDAERPSSLDLHAKKKKGIGRRVKRYLFDWSSSSSESPTSSASEPDLTQSDHIGKQSASTKGADQTVKHTNSDPKPDPATTRKNYQHNASKSMSDIDHNNPNFGEIAEKLKNIAIALQQTKYAGPSGKTDTPDSYHHDKRIDNDPNHGVNRSKSTPTAKATSMSMKTYYNMEASKQTRSGRANEPGHSPVQGRIRRSDVETWSQRVTVEKRSVTKPRLTHDRRQKEGAPSKISKSSKSSLDAAPSPRPSCSPEMRGARADRRNLVATDGGHGPHRRIVRYERHEEDVVTTVSATGISERHNSVDVYQVVQTDAGGFAGDDEDEDDVDFADGLREDDEKATQERTVSGDAEEQVAQAPARPRGRAATEPAIFAHGELDNVESDSDEGAVGGREDPADDEDKLVKEIAQLLIKKGDILNAQEQTIELSKFFVEYAARMSEANLRRLFRTAFSRVYDHATTGEHRDVMEIAIILDLFPAAIHSMQPSVLSFLKSVMDQIAISAGGWMNVLSNVDQTSEEVRGWKEGGKKHDRDEGELD